MITEKWIENFKTYNTLDDILKSMILEIYNEIRKDVVINPGASWPEVPQTTEPTIYSKEEIEKFENDHHCRLPEDYKWFITNIGIIPHFYALIFDCGGYPLVVQQFSDLYKLNKIFDFQCNKDLYNDYIESRDEYDATYFANSHLFEISRDYCQVTWIMCLDEDGYGKIYETDDEDLSEREFDYYGPIEGVEKALKKYRYENVYIKSKETAPNYLEFMKQNLITTYQNRLNPNVSPG